MAKDIYEGRLTSGDISPELVKITAKHLTSAVTEGFGKSFDSIAYDTPDYEMLTNLERNVYAFSAAKNYQELKSMTLALKDDQGKIRKFSEFQKDTAKIDKQFNVNWLQTEYDTAIGSGQMAGRWVEFEKNKRIMPLLRYETAGDARVRPDHAKLNGVTRNMDDPFWDSYYPPNGWGCRCDVSQLASGSETPESRIDPPDVPPMFRVNLAKQGLAFPQAHSYYKGVPDDVLKRAQNLEYKQIGKWAKAALVKKNVSISKTLKDSNNDPFEASITFSSKGINEAINQPHKFKYDKNLAIYKITELIRQSEYFDNAINNNVSKPQIKMYHYLKTIIKNKASFIVLREFNNGNINFYSIVDGLKKKK